MKSAFLLLVLVLGAHAQTRAFDIDACVSDIENIAKSYFHATIDWLTIIGFQHALIRMGTMLNSMGYIFVHCLGIDIPEPFADIFTVYDESLMNMPLEIMDSRIVLSGQDITEQIQAHSFPNNLQSTGEFSLERCIENVETWMEKASQAVSAVVNQSDDMVAELAGMLYAAQVMVKSCI